MANSSEALIAWLKEPPAEFEEFIDRIVEHLELAKGSAMAKGDTEYEKGQVAAFKRVVTLPQALIDSYDNTTKTEGTDSDT